ncbi:Phosphotyrosine interaction domain protein [Paragonimus heterotremus]|uniref:Phosphotyrosine interaction domain protein n=1 Tax=Paragonimus heterotremus TaxID=100268 RepID=A0A8J4WRM0_9TREM|nr:Phosphotyrosine interaction domain protein [Paragonimus heterotremus]
MMSDGIFSPPRVVSSASSSSKSLPSTELTVSSFGASHNFRSSADHLGGTPTLLYGLPPKFTEGNPRFCPITSNLGAFKTVSTDCTPVTSQGVMPFQCMLPLTDASPHENSGDPNHTTKPYVAACPEDCFAEVPLGLPVSDQTHAVIPQFDLTSLYPQRLCVDIRGDHLSPVRSGFAPSEHHPTMYDLAVCDDAVSEFLSCQNNQIDRLNLPSVEDGLSSGSDLDTPHCPVKSKSSYDWRTVHALSHSPDSTRGLFMIRKSNSHSQMTSPAGHSCTSDSMVNPPLVRDIWGIMNELKQTLADDRTNLSQPADSTTADVVTHHNTERSPMNQKNAAVDVNPKVSANSFENQAVVSTGSGNMSQQSGCSKLIVQASVEPSVSESEAAECAHGGPKFSTEEYISKNNRNQSLEESLPRDKRTQHWTFPTQSGTLYSSSEDESDLRTNSNMKSGNGPTLSELASGNTAKNHALHLSAEKSCHAEHTKTLSLERPSSPNHNERDHRIRRHSSSARQLSSGDEEHAKPSVHHRNEEFESDEDTDQLLTRQYQTDKPIYIPELKEEAHLQTGRHNRVREVSIRHPDSPDTLINGLIFRTRYLGSTQLQFERQPTRNSRMFQAQEAVNRIKAPDGENQPSVPVEFFVSTQRLMLLNSNLQEILIDHELTMVSYVADMGELFVLMARRPFNQTVSEANLADSQASQPNRSESGSVTSDCSNESADGVSQTVAQNVVNRANRSSTKLICHVLESPEARLISQSVGHAFQLAYLEFLRANGVEDLSSVDQLNYEDVLNQQEIFCDELTMFSDKDRHKQIVIPKQRGEPLGVVIVASGWGSLLPTVLLANMNPTGPAARCGQLNIGNHIISVNGQSTVGLPLNACQQIIKVSRVTSPS